MRFSFRVCSGPTGIVPLGSDTLASTSTPSASTLTLILRLRGEGGLEKCDAIEDKGDEGGDEGGDEDITLNNAVPASVAIPDEVGLAVAVPHELRDVVESLAWL